MSEVTGQSTSASAQWAVFLQYATHRDVLLTDGAWTQEDGPVRRPDLLMKPRLFNTKAAAERFIARRSSDLRPYAARWEPERYK